MFVTHNKQKAKALPPQRHSLKTKSIAQTAVMLPLGIIAVASPMALGLAHDPAAYQVLALGWLVWFFMIQRVHLVRRPFWIELFHSLSGSFVVTLLESGMHGSRTGLLAWQDAINLFAWLSVTPLAARILCRALLQPLGLWARPALIFGDGPNARETCKALRSEPWMGMQAMALANPCSSSNAIPEHGLPPRLDWSDSEQDWETLRRDYHCVISLEAEDRDERDKLIRKLSQHQIHNATVVPAMRGIPLYGLDTAHFQSHELLMIHLRNNLANPLHRACKRTFDLVAASLLLVLLSPVLLALTWQVKRDGGPAFFGHKRIGQGGKTFKCWKFRSMVVNAQEVLQELLATDAQARAEWEKEFKLKNDPRISRIGHFIRKTSLDELPQLWNVIKGEMSLVGPRPVIQAELERYGDDVTYYLEACPGLTGLWQVSGRNDVDYDTRVYLDAWYVKNWSLWTDISILFKTVGVVLGRDGAY
jgi:UDP-galactose-lipid carrier transferase